MEQTITDRRRKLEIIAVSATGLGKLIFMDYLQWIVPFLAVAIIGWTYYIYKRNQENEGILAYWGFRTENIASVTKFILPFGIVGVLSFILIGSWQGTLNLTWHIIPIFLLYPIWGIIQQFLLMSLFAGNLKDHSQNKKSNLTIIILTAILFAAVHYPYYWLIAGTFILALIYTYVFLRERNLYVLGCFHGWLGAIFYYTVMTRDPWVEMLHSLGMG